jgi:hypothetical protein
VLAFRALKKEDMNVRSRIGIHCNLPFHELGPWFSKVFTSSSLYFARGEAHPVGTEPLEKIVLRKIIVEFVEVTRQASY